MSGGSDKLARDVAVLTAMAGDMPAYLDSDVLFWPMSRSNMPQLTLGGYLMREYRLRALPDRLPAEQQQDVASAISAFNQSLADRVARFETKAHAELQARLRQWEEYLKDIDRGSADRTSNYATAVETRAMIQAILDRLSLPPYRLESRPVSQLAMLDERLRNRFSRGEFIWPAEWEPAYPAPDFWWLYGAPRVPANKVND
jgi:hypothetical protein